ncbi:hypothetical protein GO613_19710 [Azoarcus communis]|uniref:Cytochrome C oxidase subunit I n=1 Tax=Parazoarcus communis SWub3 = DSM 12120 TaxID=1121029 RepID=A0A323UTP3_9RHOO|nr:hypothetical protein [Parazoarcus communis]NMG50323.1 hypothetical protein [Parazoarcus communis]NMG71359.1 hypothetical protein [Parazoarcus communis SWub3 = DSM 12120]PZA15661.1 hypothetical protein DNK49_15765 [Azoarcus communis] [Parazoarcus communis SWub3 = DSM 12120]
MTTLLLADSSVAETARLPDPVVRRRARLTLAVLALVCTLPVIASYLMFYVWPPQGRVNHGELLPPALLPGETLAGLAGQAPLMRGELEGQWTLVTVAPAACDERCQQALYVSRQARVAQAKEMERVARLWLVSEAGDPAESLLQAHADLRLARADAAWLAALPADPAGAVWLVDPLGQVMMRFGPDIDRTRAARGMTKDLQRLLKYSALGRGGRE